MGILRGDGKVPLIKVCRSAKNKVKHTKHFVLFIIKNQ